MILTVHSLPDLLCPRWARQYRSESIQAESKFQHDCSTGSLGASSSGNQPSENHANQGFEKPGDSSSCGERGNENRSGNPHGDGEHSRMCQPRFHLLLSYAGWQTDPWVDRLPRLLEPMGIYSHRAVNGREASQLIQKQAIHVAVVDLGLPLDDTDPQQNDEFAEGGPRLLELLSRLEEPPPVVVVKRSRTHRDDSREIAAALRLGAFAVVDRPHDAQGLNLMLEVFRRCMARHYRGCWPGA